MEKSRLKLTTAKVEFKVEPELSKIRCSYWVSFTLSFWPGIILFRPSGLVGGVRCGESEHKVNSA